MKFNFLSSLKIIVVVKLFSLYMDFVHIVVASKFVLDQKK